jgi:glyoxylase-like metal-dependent hydrolase (beta-lactamase superfamily II)
MTASKRTTSPRIVSAGQGTYLIDLFHQGEPRTIGSFLLLGEKPALIEVGPANALEHLLAGVREAGLEPENLRCVFLTHIHLDHAGATGGLLERYPHLEVFVHPAGAPHLIEPERLWGSARRVFGERLDALFGEPRPVPERNLRLLTDGDEVSLGERRLRAVHTPGHAAHHLAFWEAGKGWLFGGDVIGCELPDSFYVYPPTPAPEVDLEGWRESLARVQALEPKRLLYSHFGWTEAPGEALEALERELMSRARLVKHGLEAGMSDEEIIVQFIREFDEPLAAQVGPVLARRFLLLGDSAINAPGLMRYWRKKHA